MDIVAKLKAHSLGPAMYPELQDDILEAKSEIERLRQCLGQSCRQWRMYADLQEDRDIATEQSVEGVLYRKCIEAGAFEQSERKET